MAGRVGAERIHPEAGTTSAAFLKIGMGARPVGMGEAFTAVAGDAHALPWNPASIASLASQQLVGTHNESFEDLTGDFVAYARPLKPGPRGARALGLHLLTLVPPRQEFRSGLGEGDALNPLTSAQGEFGAYDLALGVTYAQALGDFWSAGGTFHLIRQAIGADHAGTVAVNLGLLRKTPIRGLSAGASILNFGPGVTFEKSYRLPLTVRAGVSYAGVERALATADISKSIDDYPILSAGLELRPFAFLTVRGGYRYRLAGNPLGGYSGTRLGAGFKVGTVSLDYAYAPFGGLGSSHRLSLSLPWGGVPPIPPQEAARPVLPSMAAAPAPLPLPPVAVPEGLPQLTNAFQVTTKPRSITSQGMVLEVKAVAQNPQSLREAEFKALVTRVEPISFEVSESTDAGGFKISNSTYAFYRRLQVRHTLRAQLRAVALRFGVENSWLSENGIKPEKVVLFRLHDGEARDEMTLFKEMQGALALYEALPEFLGEHWVIAGERPRAEKGQGAEGQEGP